MKIKVLISLPCFLAATLSFGIFSGCQKESTVKPLKSSVSSSENTDALKNTEGIITLELQPGEDGQDTYVYYFEGSPAHSETNFNSVPEMATDVWTNNGASVIQRSFIKFTGLSAIPANAQIISAELFLSGLRTSLNHIQGNSVYPGSPYLPEFSDNSCYVQTVKSGWDESTITWNNQPEASSLDQAVIPSSTKQWNQKATVDVKSLVRKIVTQQKNYGFRIIQTNESIYRCQQFAVSEDPVAVRRPRLLVKYKLL